MAKATNSRGKRVEVEGYIRVCPIFLVPAGLLSVSIAKHPVDVNVKIISCHELSIVTSLSMLQVCHKLHPLTFSLHTLNTWTRLCMKRYSEVGVVNVHFDFTFYCLELAQSSSSSSSGTKMSCSSRRAAKFLLIRVPTYKKGTTTAVMRIRPNGVWKHKEV